MLLNFHPRAERHVCVFHSRDLYLCLCIAVKLSSAIGCPRHHMLGFWVS